MRYGVKVVAIVVGISILYVLVMILQFDEYKRNTIHEAHHICPTLVDRSLYPKFSNGNKLVVIDIGKIHDAGTYLFCLAIRFQASDRHTITQITILLLVDLHQRLRAHVAGHALDGFRQLLVGHPRVETFQSHTEMAHQHHLALSLTSKCSLFAKHLVIEGIHRYPTKFLFLQLGCRFLYEKVFAIVFCHNYKYLLL